MARLSTGVYALVVIGGVSRRIIDTERIYDFLVEKGVEQFLAADASSWAELAVVGETYNVKEFDIYMEE